MVRVPGELSVDDQAYGVGVRVFEDFLPEALLQAAQKDSEELYTRGNTFWTNRGFPPHLIQQSTIMMITHIKNELINKGVKREVNKKISDVGYENFSVDNNADNKTALYQIWPAGSYIPWHDDGAHIAGLTIYLSDHGTDDGGYFMYDDGKGIKAVKPKPNRAVLQTGGLYHTVTTVNMGAPARRTIQVWFHIDK